MLLYMREYMYERIHVCACVNVCLHLRMCGACARVWDRFTRLDVRACINVYVLECVS